MNIFKNYAPYGWDAINFHEGCYVPSELHTRENVIFALMQRALFQRASSVIDLEVPEEWEGDKKDFLYWCLTRRGFVYAGESDVYKKCFTVCDLQGYNFYYQPTHALIYNPYNKDPDLDGVVELDKRGALIKWSPDFMGCWDVINYFAEKLALISPVEDISIRNNAMAWVYLAATPQAAASFKKAMDEIYSGKPGVVVDKNLLLNDTDRDKDPFQFLDRKNIAQSYILDKLLTDFNTILAQFDAEIGIPTMSNQSKKERMVVDEANSRKADATARSAIWIRSLQSSIKHLNDVLGYDFGLKAKLHYEEEEPERKEGDQNVTDENDNPIDGKVAES